VLVAVAGKTSAASQVLLAVSKEEDPSGDWLMAPIAATQKDANVRGWVDYPCVGMDKDRLVIQGRIMPDPGATAAGGQAEVGREDAGSRLASILFVIDKDPFYQGETPRKRVVRLPAGTQVPAVSYDGRSPLYLVWSYADAQGLCCLRVLVVDDAGQGWNDLALPAVDGLTPWDFNAPDRDFAPQKGSRNRIDTGDARVQNVVLRDGKLWFVHSIYLPATDQAAKIVPTHCAIQWWQLEPKAELRRRVVQWGRIGGPGADYHYAYPSVAVNRHGEALIGFSRFAKSEFASAAYVFRAPDDPEGQFRPAHVFQEGVSDYSYPDEGGRNRWGDYSNTLVDPNGHDFWTIQKFAARPFDQPTPKWGLPSRWGTSWARILRPATRSAKTVLQTKPVVDLAPIGPIQFSAASKGPPAREVARAISGLMTIRPFVKLAGPAPGQLAEPALPLPAAAETAVAPGAVPAFRLTLNRPLPTDKLPGQGLYLASEPSVMANGQDVLVTARWLAAASGNGGASFELKDPSTVFPARFRRQNVGSGYPINQTLLFEPRQKLALWLLCYMGSEDGGSGLRLAYAWEENFHLREWRYLEITPRDLGGFDLNFELCWFDFPNIAVHGKYVYLAVNVFSPLTRSPVEFLGSAVMRVPLERLSRAGKAGPGDQPPLQTYFLDGILNPVAVRGASGPMRWVAHTGTSTVRVYSWPEDDALSAQDVTISAWNPGPFQSLDREQHNWLGHTDGRILTAWRLQGKDGEVGKIGFAWNAGPARGFPQPHVRAVLLDENSLSVIAQPVLWNRDYAFAFPAIAVNGRGELGISVHYGGGPRYPSHAVGRWIADEQHQTGRWELSSSAEGQTNREPYDWGPSLSIQADDSDPGGWVAAGPSLKRKPAGNQPESEVEIRLIKFTTTAPDAGGPAPGALASSPERHQP
jgi:hypothetical protein